MPEPLDPRLPAQAGIVPEPLDSQLPARAAIVPDPLDPRLPAPVIRRTRHGRHPAVPRAARRRLGTPMLARRRRVARRACPFGWQVRVLGGPPRKRRHLWTECHRQASGSQS
jgi:hypothetical protein